MDKKLVIVGGIFLFLLSAAVYVFNAYENNESFNSLFLNCNASLTEGSNNDFVEEAATKFPANFVSKKGFYDSPYFAYHHTVSCESYTVKSPITNIDRKTILCNIYYGNIGDGSYSSIHLPESVFISANTTPTIITVDNCGFFNTYLKRSK